MKDKEFVYRLVTDEEFLRTLKVESAKVGKAMKCYIIEAVNEKIIRDKKKK